LIEINKAPKKETNFNIPIDQYSRSIHRCLDCNIYFSQHNYDFEELYKGNYNNSTYANCIQANYLKIMNLNPKLSDNFSRCQRIDQELKKRNFERSKTFILDIGSGLCVFLGKMKELGYPGFAIDPDAESIRHATEYVKIQDGFCGELKNFSSSSPFKLITMNKVLEHVKNPCDLLSDALKHLEKGGLCYLELPDGPNAHANGGLIDREEFYIEHYFCFSKQSFQILMQKVGLTEIEIHAICEPSGKYTLYGFGLKP